MDTTEYLIIALCDLVFFYQEPDYLRTPNSILYKQIEDQCDKTSYMWITNRQKHAPLPPETMELNVTDENGEYLKPTNTLLFFFYKM